MSRLLRFKKKKEYPDEVTKKYEVGRYLGKGAFGVVKQCKVRRYLIGSTETNLDYYA